MIKRMTEVEFNMTIDHFLCASDKKASDETIEEIYRRVKHLSLDEFQKAIDRMMNMNTIPRNLPGGFHQLATEIVGCRSNEDMRLSNVSCEDCAGSGSYLYSFDIRKKSRGKIDDKWTRREFTVRCHCENGEAFPRLMSREEINKELIHRYEGRIRILDGPNSQTLDAYTRFSDEEGAECAEKMEQCFDWAKLAFATMRSMYEQDDPEKMKRLLMKCGKVYLDTNDGKMPEPVDRKKEKSLAMTALDRLKVLCSIEEQKPE